MNLIAQIPGADVAIKAAEASGWTAVLLCVTFLFTLAAMTWLIKKMFAEKDDLSQRLTSVEDFQKTSLTEMHVKTETGLLKAAIAMDNNSLALGKLTDILAGRPCLRKTTTA